MHSNDFRFEDHVWQWLQVPPLLLFFPSLKQTHTLLLEHFLRSAIVVNIYPVACVGPTTTLVWCTVCARCCNVSHVRTCAHILRKPSQQHHGCVYFEGRHIACAGPCSDVTSRYRRLAETLVLSLLTPLPLTNFRLVLPVQHMTLSLCCLAKHWPRLPTHSHASWTNEVKAVHKRKVALGVKTGKSCSCPDTVCQQCCSFYRMEI